MYHPEKPEQAIEVLEPPVEVPFTIPTRAAFRQHFARTVWGGQEPVTRLFNFDSFSALRYPEERPRALAFLDMDEVVGNLGGSLRLLMHSDYPPDYFTHAYGGKDMFFAHEDHLSRNALIRLVKNHRQPEGIGMQPVADIDSIVSTVRSWRRGGVYVTFLTSATMGAELSHIDFLATYFTGACDGAVITRGPTGEYINKGETASRIASFVHAAPGTPVIAIDDVGTNTKNLRAALQNHPAELRVETFQHVFASNSKIDPGSVHARTPLDAFTQANYFLSEALGETLHIPLQITDHGVRAWMPRN